MSAAEPSTRKKRAPDCYFPALRVIESAAANGHLAPDNATIADVLGGNTVSVGANAVKSLEEHGFIRVERFSQARVITVLSTGKSTAVPAGKRRPHFRIARPQPAYTPPPAQAPRHSPKISQDAAKAGARSCGSPDDLTLEDEIHIEAIRTGTKLSDLYAHIVFVGWHAYLENLRDEMGWQAQ